MNDQLDLDATRCPGCGDARCKWPRLECDAPVLRGFQEQWR